MFFDQLVIFDQMKRCITVVVYADTSSATESILEEIYQDSVAKINRIKELMRDPIKESHSLNWNDNNDLDDLLNHKPIHQQLVCD